MKDFKIYIYIIKKTFEAEFIKRTYLIYVKIKTFNYTKLGSFP